MNINDFEYYIPTSSTVHGKKLANKKAVKKIVLEKKGCISVSVEDDKIYDVKIKITGSGEIIKTDSDCDCKMSENSACRHIAAALYAVRKEFESKLSTLSSNGVSTLISDYCRMADSAVAADVPEEEKIHIIPEISSYGQKLSYSLKIGKTQMYVVSDICKLKMNFNFGYSHRYGKALDFVHTYSEIDERSRKLLDLSYMFFYSHDASSYSYYSQTKRDIELTEGRFESFFSLFKDDYVNCDDRKCFVKFENPVINVIISAASNDRFQIKPDKSIQVYGTPNGACFFNSKDSTFYIPSAKFNRTVVRFMLSCSNMNNVYVAKDDMPAFYNSVLKPLCKYISIKGLELLENIIPPEVSASLYLDCPDGSIICARLEFNYADKIFPAFYEQKSNQFCDYATERRIETEVLKYFDRDDTDSVHPLVISSDEKVYVMLTEGIEALNRIMDVFASERFKRVAVRPPVQSKIGVKPNGNLLELEITADGYTNDELISVLTAYKKGSKYHRLKDGSFALMDDSLGELAEFTESLNISDKALLKEKINIPKYRMLYLDSLKSESGNLRVKRSNDFKETVINYNSTIEDSEKAQVPQSLDDIMRDYQKYGFRWMKTISAYGFGGVLADDMGLGKTIQAIALMLDAKQKSDEHLLNIVICPSSLTLNWENEIKKFAPELSSIIVTGIASVRNELIEQAQNYDVVVTSYSLLTRDIAKYENMNFHFQFVDEAQYIKNHSTQASKAVKGLNSQIRYALTGTPVENSLAELWSIFDFIMPDYLFNYTYFKKNFETPIVAKSDSKAVSTLQKIVSPFILRRLKKEVLSELPDKTESILYAEMESEQSKVYSANVAEIKMSLGKNFDSNTERIKILAMLTRLRQICCDPALVYENYKGSSAKLEQCIELIDSCVNSGHKILLFSQFTSMLDIISKRLNKLDISFYTLTGKTKPNERIRLVNQFNEDDTKVFLISLKAGGTGLNLTGADIVIHYDPWWNVSAENQASDRAYRIGQKRNVQIYKLITEKTIEENIRKLQQSKAELYDIAVNGEGDIMHMSADDIISILE